MARFTSFRLRSTDAFADWSIRGQRYFMGGVPIAAKHLARCESTSTSRGSFSPVGACTSTTNRRADVETHWPVQVHKPCAAVAQRAIVDAVNQARLILTCGLPGAGKTTLATQLAADRNALRLTKDEWMWALGSSPWDALIQEKVERELWHLAQEVLRLGLSVVLDFGLWARIERDELRSVARSLGVGVELHYLGASTDELWRRIEARNSEPPWNSEPISRAHLDEWAASFQAPDAAELALFDTPEETADC
ncbi:MAG TPA: AAA family ATPase [Ilumatobacteraceae bacterium]|nr:AAA family ATPase [Ilumatobacteraceae bacterium]